MNQPDVRRGLDQLGIATPQSQEKWVEENIEKGAKREPEVVEFTIYDRTDSTAGRHRRPVRDRPRPRHGRIRHRDR